MDHDTRFQPMPPLIDENTVSSEASDHPKAATNFSGLPFEIRTEIYSLAIPLSRVLRMRLNRSPELGIYAESTSHPCIPTILHINRESRAVGLKIFKLSFGASPTQAADGSVLKERELFRSYWNPAIDTLYLPFLNPLESHPIQATMDHITPTPRYSNNWGDVDACLVGSGIYHKHRILSHVRHLALPDNHKTKTGFRPPLPHDAIIDSEKFTLGNLPAWIHGFEKLESLTLLRDPFPGWYRSGEILLYEPDDDNEDEYCRRALKYLRETEGWVQEALEVFAKGKDWEAPSVELLIMGNRKTRKPPAFCIKPKKRL